MAGEYITFSIFAIGREAKGTAKKPNQTKPNPQYKHYTAEQ